MSPDWGVTYLSGRSQTDFPAGAPRGARVGLVINGQWNDLVERHSQRGKPNNEQENKTIGQGRFDGSGDAWYGVGKRGG